MCQVPLGPLKVKFSLFTLTRLSLDTAPPSAWGLRGIRVPHLGIFSSLETGGHEPAGCEWHPSGRGRGPGCGVRNPDR